MRSPIPAVAACLLLASLAGACSLAWAVPQNAPAVGTPAAGAKSPPAPTPTASADSEAVAKHAKRMACLKSAKEKKLVGPQKTAFLKDCIGPS